MKINLLKNIAITLGFLSVHTLFAWNNYPIQESKQPIVPTSQELSNISCCLEGGARLDNDFNCCLMMDPAIEEGTEFLEKELIESGKKSTSQIKSSTSSDSSSLSVSSSISNQRGIETTAIRTIGGIAQGDEIAQSIEQEIGDKTNLSQHTTFTPQAITKRQHIWIKQPAAVIFFAGCYAVAHYIPKCLGMLHEVTDTSLDKFNNSGDSIWLNQNLTAHSAWVDAHEKDQAAQVVFGQVAYHQPIEGYANIKEQAEAKSEAIVEKIRIIAEKLQDTRSKVEIATGDSLSCWKEAIASLEKSIKYWEKTFETQKTEVLLTVDYSLAASESEQAAEYSKQAAEAYVLAIGEDENWRIGNRWQEASESIQLSADCQIKAIETQSIGREDRVQQYTEISRVVKQASEKFIQAAQLLQEGKEIENYTLYYQGEFLQSEAIGKKYRLQEQEAQEAGKRELAVGYREAAETFQKAANAKKLSLARYIDEEDDEARIFASQGDSLQKQAHYQAKAIEAQEAGKLSLAVGYQEAADISQRAANVLQLLAERQESIRSGWLVIFVQSQISYDQNDVIELREFANMKLSEDIFLESEVDYEAKAIKAKEAGKMELARECLKAVELFQKAANMKKLADEKRIAGQEGEGNAWESYGDSLQKKADYQAKAIEAKEAGRKSLAVGYQEIAETFQGASDVYKLSAEKSAEGKESESISCYEEGVSLEKKADYQAKALNAQEAGKNNLAAAYREAAETSQGAAEAHKLSTEKAAQGKKGEEHSWYSYGGSLQSKAYNQAKAGEAQEIGKVAWAVNYLKIADNLQKDADRLKLAAERYAIGESEWNQGISLQKEADYRAKIAELEEAGKRELAVGYREAAIISQKAADQFNLSIKKQIERQVDEGISLGWLADSLQKKADYQAKAIEAEEIGKRNLAIGYQEAVAISQRAVDQWGIAAKAFTIGTRNEAINWQKQGKSLQVQADYQAKANEATTRGEAQLSTKYNNVAIKYRQAAEKYEQAAKFRKEHPWSLGASSLDEEGEALYEQAEELIKNIS
ncbi:MAG TPA: hypothetical protein VJK54_03390 [Chthoniobacterales bacterium]|nr:hypothetical protein [Chthoniobacterales bacterium]